jgi:outer membrane usher protein
VGVPIDLVIEGGPAQAPGLTIDAFIAEGAVSVDRAQLVAALMSILDEPVLARLRAAGPGDERALVPLADVEAVGIGAAFDPARIRVVVRVPAELRRPLRVAVSGHAGPEARVVETPADFSAAVNLRARAAVRFGADVSVPIELSLQPALNWRGWVLEADASAEWDGSFSASLDTARLVRDFPAAATRLTAGSLFLPVTGLLSSSTLAGIEVTHRPEAYRPEGPLVSVDEGLFVTDPTRVDVTLNGRSLGSLPLEAGRYVIPDVPFVSGLNELVLDDERRIVPFDSRLLPTGESAFSASVGIPQWALADPVFSGFFLRGFAPFITAGVGAQAGLDRVMGGAEVLLATGAGNFRGLAGASWSAAAGVDFSGALEYRLAFPSAARLPALNLAARYTGRTFLGPLDDRDENPCGWQVSGSLSQALPFGFGLNLGAGWQGGWEAAADVTTASLTLTRAVASGTSLALLVTAQFAAGSDPEVRGILTVTASAPGGRRSAGMAASLDSGSTSVDLHLQPFADRRAPTVYATLNGLPTETGGSSGTVGALYIGRALEATLSDSFASGANSLSLEAAAAVVTAGGALAFSRPVADSFAIVVPRQNMADQKVVVNRGAGERETTAERGRPAALPWLQSFAPITITVEAPEAPPGTEAGELLRTLAPTYRSGIAVMVGGPATIYAEGYLLSAEGKAVAWKTGEVRPEGDSGAAPITVFTDENGMFQVYGLAPGIWAIAFPGDEPYRTLFTIPGDAEGLFGIGSFRLPIRGMEG